MASNAIKNLNKQLVHISALLVSSMETAWNLCLVIDKITDLINAEEKLGNQFSDGGKQQWSALLGEIDILIKKAASQVKKETA